MQFKLKFDLGEGTFHDFTDLIIALDKVRHELTFITEYPPTANVKHRDFTYPTKWSICIGD